MWSLLGMAVAAPYVERVHPPPASPTDADLVTAFKEGDVRAFDVLFARYRQPIFGYIYRSVGAASLAEELTQDVFLKVFQHLRRTGENVSIRAWMYRIATTTCIDAHRAATRRPALVNDAEALMSAPGGIDPVERHLERERRREVRSALDALAALAPTPAAPALGREFRRRLRRQSAQSGLTAGLIVLFAVTARSLLRELKLVRRKDLPLWCSPPVTPCSATNRWCPAWRTSSCA